MAGRRAVFLDRDGTLIEEVNWLRDPAQVAVIPGAAAAIADLRRRGWLVVLITNQSVIARGLCTEERLAEIHGHLGDLLGREGAKLDGIYFCPHHPGPMPDAGRPDLVRQCECRKPGLGMIWAAARELGIDLENSWMVGDTTGDIQTAVNGGLRSVLVQTGHAGRDRRYRVTPTATVSSICEAARVIV